MQKRRPAAAEAPKKAEPPPPPVQATPKPKVKKLTYAERLELDRIDKELPQLEKRKEELLTILGQGIADHHKMMERSIELERTVQQLDRMSERWLELMERAEG